jgi:hypothetical protein
LVIYRALHRQGWRKVQPRPKRPKADAETQAEFKKLPELVREEVMRQAETSRPVRLMLEDEARFGRIRDPRRCGAPPGVRPEVEVQVVREYEYAYGAVSPQDGLLDTLVLPEVHAGALGVFLAEVAHRHAGEFILVVLDGAGWHKAQPLQVPGNMRLISRPSWSPQLSGRTCLGRVAQKVVC